LHGVFLKGGLHFVDFSPYFYYFTPFDCFGLACSCFSRSLRYSIGLLFEIFLCF
jgi:hypothetical protein